MVGKSRVPVQNRGKETKNSIIRAARELFADNGYHGTNSKEIAARAGVSTGSFYSYFDDKKQVFMEVFRGYYRDITESVFGSIQVDITESADKRSLIRQLLWQLFLAHDIAPGLHRESIAMVYADPDIARISREENEKVISIISSFLEEIKGHLRVQDVAAAARGLHASAEAVIHSIRIFGTDIDEERMLDALEDMISTYLLGET